MMDLYDGTASANRAEFYVSYASKYLIFSNKSSGVSALGKKYLAISHADTQGVDFYQDGVFVSTSTALTLSGTTNRHRTR